MARLDELCDLTRVTELTLEKKLSQRQPRALLDQVVEDTADKILAGLKGKPLAVAERALLRALTAVTRPRRKAIAHAVHGVAAAAIAAAATPEKFASWVTKPDGDVVLVRW